VRRVVAQLAAGHPALAGLGVTRLGDYETRERRDLLTGAVTPIDLPATPLVVLEMADGSTARLRPSGTEPKLKIYLEAAEPPAPRPEIAAGRRRAAATLDRLEGALRTLLAPESDE
jgi:phosphomannomutase